MKNLVVINTGDGESPSRNVGGKAVFHRVLDRVLGLAGRENIALLGAGIAGATEGFRRVEPASGSDRDLVGALAELGRGYDNIVYVYGDCPFLDTELCVRMLENHRRYYAQYSFADGYPCGLTPEIVQTGVLPALAALAREPSSPAGRDTLFTLIQRDINAFDIETELSPKDLRLLRASLTSDSDRNRLLCERIAAENPENSGDIIRILEEKPEVLRTLPAYVSVQITEGCPQSCFSCPFPRFGGDILSKRGSMDPGDFDIIAGKTAKFCGDAVIGVSLWGEPSLHPGFTRLARSVAERPGLKMLVETSGIGWTDEILRETGRILEGRISWIVSLDAADEELYTRLRGPGFGEALKTAGKLLEMFPDTAYVQALRMEENEDKMESFYRGWKEKTQHIIIQKYDWFCGFLPQRKVTDLSPLDRFPCRHLQRELSVLIDGTVPLCREDLGTGIRLGNLVSDSMEDIWERGGKHYREHLEKRYSGICGNCDEYYTYNF